MRCSRRRYPLSAAAAAAVEAAAAAVGAAWAAARTSWSPNVCRFGRYGRWRGPLGRDVSVPS